MRYIYQIWQAYRPRLSGVRDSAQYEFTYGKIQDGGHPPYKKNKNCYNFAAVWDAFTKFDLQVGLVISESVIVPNMT